MAEDAKFYWDHESGVFRNRVSGEAIPKDEPVMIFRARDAHAPRVLAYYAGIVEDPHHQRAVDQTLNDFLRYRRDNPDKVKEPGITHDFRLREE